LTRIWRISDDYPEEWMGIYDTDLSPDRFLFRRGERLELGGRKPIIRFGTRLANLRGLESLPNSAMIPLVSRRVVLALESLCPDDFHAVPAEVVAADGPIDGFSMVNVVAVAEMIDLPASATRLIPGTDKVMKFRRLALKPGGIGAHHLARDPAYRSFLFVSGEVHALFERGDWRDREFVRPEDIGP